MQMAAVYGAPPVDFLPQQDPVAYDQLVRNAESFIAARFLPSLASLKLQPIVHIVKVITLHNPSAPLVALQPRTYVSLMDCCSLIMISLQSEVDTESIGNVVCKKAENLDVAAIIVSLHSKSRLQEFFLGSITNYCA
jgi:hypothetical protein